MSLLIKFRVCGSVDVFGFLFVFELHRFLLLILNDDDDDCGGSFDKK